MILTDAAGVVLTRLAADSDLDRHLDGVQLAPGFSYAEDQVGTNGIGTALEGGQPMHVFGHEHYAENLEDLACAGVPIHHPITGKIVGAVDLTCWRKDADPLLIALVKTTADQITQGLLTDSSAQEYELLQEYLRACRRTSGIVLALNNDVLMMNEYARRVLDPGDQIVLLGQAAEALASGRPGASEVELPTGVTARMHCRPPRPRQQRPRRGGVVHVKLIEAPAAPVTGAAVPGADVPARPGRFGGAVAARLPPGRGPAQSGEWLALAGEPGAGKLALLRAVHQRHNPAAGLHVLDAAEAAGPDWLTGARRELLSATGDLVIAHVDRLNARQLHVLSGALREARAAGRADVALGRGHARRTAAGRAPDRAAAILPEHGGAAAAAASFRGHARAGAVLPAQAEPARRLTCSPEAMQLLGGPAGRATPSSCGR